MSVIDTLLRLQYQRQADDDQSMNRGFGLVQGEALRQDGLNRAEAEKKRPLSDPMQKFMRHVMEGRMTGRQAGIAAKMMKAGMLPEDFDPAEPSPQMEQGPTGGFKYGAPPGMPGAPGYQEQGSTPVQGPVNMPPMREPSQGFATQPAQPRGMSQLDPSYKFTAQDLSDAGGIAGLMPKEFADSPEAKMMRLLELYKQKGKLQDDDQEFKGGEGDKNRGQKQGQHEDRTAIAREKITTMKEEGEKARQNALTIAAMKISQSERNSLRTHGTAEDIKLLTILERKQANLSNNAAKLATSINSMGEDPNTQAELARIRAEIARDEEDVQDLFEQVKSRVKTKPISEGTSTTSGKTGPAPSAQDLLKKVRGGQ